jgi:hypothetical protein
VISVLLIIVGWLLKSDNGGTTTTAHLPTTPKAFSTNHSPSKTRVAAGAFGFLTLIQLFFGKSLSGTPHQVSLRR